jgi:hypothetical protein
LALDGCRCVDAAYNQNLIDEYNQKWDELEDDQEEKEEQDPTIWSGFWGTVWDFFGNESQAAVLSVSSVSMIVSVNLY